jgi:hypothetical protein
MAQRILSASFLAMLICTGAVYAEQLPPDATALHAAVYPRLQPTVQRWITAEAKSPRLAQMPPPRLAPALRDAVRTRFAGDNLPASDIDALVVLILIQASRDMESDLRAHAQKVKAINETKKAMRELVERLKNEIARNGGKTDTAPCLPPQCGEGISRQVAAISSAQRRDRLAPTLTPVEIKVVGDLKTLRADLKSRLDSLSEMGELESLRLQMAMDRQSKMMSTLSNIMKTMSKTASSIVENLK